MPDAFEFLSVQREGHVTIITIDRPRSHNALNAAANVEMDRAFDAFAADDDQWIAIITGAGDRAFCAGYDLKEHAGGGGIQMPATGFGGIASRFDLDKPLIAAVNGVALGGGFEIALACDIVVASANATFGLLEARVGLAAMGGGMQRLPRAIGMKHAMGLLLTGRTMSAQEAADLGLVNELVETDPLSAARRWAEQILLCSPLSARATKSVMRRGQTLADAQALPEAWGYPEVQAMLASEDAIEGSAAFAEKRPPVWKGR